MAQLATNLASLTRVDRVVLDRTGLTGNFDLDHQAHREAL
jgi:uncharacterized protein (TIGR03435 family)